MNDPVFDSPIGGVTPSELNRFSPAFVTARAPGKVNLSLRVGGLDQHGYHPLINVFQAVGVWEEITATPRVDDQIVLTVQGPGARYVPLGETNLVTRAARAMQRASGVRDGVNLHIVKGVPVAGGMAGGSADAAATLVALNALWRLELSLEELMRIGAPLGADVPFSLFGGTAVGFGRGDELTALTDNGHYHWVFALRSRGLSTADVFARFDELVPAGHELDDSANQGLYEALERGDVAGVARNLHNDLQLPSFDMAPDLHLTVEHAKDLGALAVLLSGSGPTIAVLVSDADHALMMRDALVEAGVCMSALVASGPVRGAYVV